jgi:hypothetical protein
VALSASVGINPKWREPHGLYCGGVFEGDFDAFKKNFDEDPLGREQAATGHTLLRSVDNPNEIFVRVEFDSVEEANSFREKIRNSDVLQNLTVKVPPTVAEVADQATYVTDGGVRTR